MSIMFRRCQSVPSLMIPALLQVASLASIDKDQTNAVWNALGKEWLSAADLAEEIGISEKVKADPVEAVRMRLTLRSSLLALNCAGLLEVAELKQGKADA